MPCEKKKKSKADPVTTPGTTTGERKSVLRKSAALDLFLASTREAGMERAIANMLAHDANRMLLYIPDKKGSKAKKLTYHLPVTPGRSKLPVNPLGSIEVRLTTTNGKTMNIIAMN
jgi:hypothetical protein